MTFRAIPLEIELKRLLVGEGAAERLSAVLGTAVSDRCQINHVFDTEAFALRQSRHALRLRQEEDRYILTAKGPSKSLGTSVSSRAEVEAEIDADAARRILTGQLDLMDVLAARARDLDRALWAGLQAAREGQALREVGSFRNRRRTFLVTLPSGIELQLELDQTELPNGRTEQEVEIELPDPSLVTTVEAWWEQLASRAGVTTQPSSAKLARFYAALAGGGT